MKINYYFCMEQAWNVFYSIGQNIKVQNMALKQKASKEQKRTKGFYIFISPARYYYLQWMSG